MKKFGFSEQGFKQYRKKWLSIAIPTGIGFQLLVIFSVLLGPRHNSTETLPLAILILTLVYGFALYRSLRRQKYLLLNYSITIIGSEITRKQPNVPPLTIDFTEIKEIVRNKFGSLRIRGAAAGDIMLIPFSIDDHSILEQQLRTLAPNAIWTRAPLYLRYRALFTWLFMGIVLLLLTATNKLVILFSGLIIIGTLQWIFHNLRTSRNITSKAKGLAWLAFYFSIVVVYWVYLRLHGHYLGG